MSRLRQLSAILFAALAVALLGAGVACADEGFGLKDLDTTFTDQNGATAMQAGSHPFAFTTVIDANTTIGEHGEVPIGSVKDLRITQPSGLVGDPTATPRCSSAVFLASVPGNGGARCPNDTVVGVSTAVVGVSGPELHVQPLYNLVPPPGAILKLGFITATTPVTFEIGLSHTYPYNPVITVADIPQTVGFYGSKTTAWGDPVSPLHDHERGSCLGIPNSSCPIEAAEPRAFLTLPRSCTGPLPTLFEADSWQDPGSWLRFPKVLTHDDSNPSNPLGLGNCGKLGFAPRIDSQPTSDHADSPSGLDFSIDVNDENLLNPDGQAQSDIKKMEIILPEGVTANPSLAEGLATCSEADLDAETLSSGPGEGCPQASKIGTVEIESPLLEGALLKGSLFIATQNENPFHSLLALYLVIKDPGLGILVKLPVKVEPDPRTGQLISILGEAPYEVPQLPFSHARVHLREGGRSPLITPSRCGDYETKAVFTPWADPSRPLAVPPSAFHVTQGVGGGPCPPAGPPPFAPGFQGGSLNNSAGAYSPFELRLLRRDGDQDMTRFSFDMPPGLTAKLAGLTKCPDAAIAAAKTKSGREELANPSCPPSSQIGHAIGGAGVGSQLTYVGGSLYLAGPVGPDPLSVVAIVPAVAGPFDVGTVVVRAALHIDPKSAKVEVDGSRSDPIPHILAGIPLRVREVRASVDRQDFTLNPTSCDPFEIGAMIWGGGADPFSVADDSPVSTSARYQTANCAALGFKPKLSLKLKGGTKRGSHPRVFSTYTPRPGDANLSRLVLRLPRSAFLDQGHIRTICTRVQFAAHSCPPGAIYGHARVFTPILDGPAEGPVYLRSSNHNLPDFVLALKGPPSLPIEVEAAARVDSKHGGIRLTFTGLPDVPVSKAIVDTPAGKKGLIVNSRDLCLHASRANLELSAQSAKTYSAHPLVEPTGCAKARKH